MNTAEYEMTKEDWITMNLLMRVMRMVCTKGVVATRREASKALREFLQPPSPSA